MKAILLFGFLLPLIAVRAESLQKAAVLFLPEQVECKSNGGASLAGEVGFRWDENEPLLLSLFSNPKAGGLDQVFGTIQVYDEKDRALDKAIFMTLPPIPDKEVIIRRGELRKFALWELHSTTIFPRPGSYYAVASFNYAISGRRTVSFTTTKRWFKVVKAAPKPKKI